MAGASLLLQLVSFVPLALAGWLCLARADLAPGGWRVATLLEDQDAAKARARALHALSRLDEIRAAQRSVPEGGLLWIGASTVERFPVREHWPRTPQLNAGIAATRADTLARLVPRLVPPLEPGGVVVLAGTADRLALPGHPDEAAAAVARLLDALRARLPRTPVLVVGPLPERAPLEGEPPRGDAGDEVRALSAALRAAAEARGMAFVDPAREPLVDGRFRLRRECATDEVHLSPMGYSHLAQTITAGAGPLGALLRP